MSYDNKERDDAILRIANGETDFTDAALYEAMASFKWITIEELNNIKTAALTNSGKDLSKRLQKNFLVQS